MSYYNVLEMNFAQQGNYGYNQEERGSKGLNQVLYIVGLGSKGLDKLTHGTYKLLVGAEEIFVWTSHHPAVQQMSCEGLSYESIFGEEQKLEIDENFEEILEKVKHRLLSSDADRHVVLALPGRPLRESRLVTSLEQVLSSYFQVDSSQLLDNDSLDKLVAIMTELRSEWGCPWDREQDHQSLKKHLIEEAYEVIEAIENQDMHNLCEELGDLLLQIVFHCQVAKENGSFSMPEVIQGISDKLIRRHPHIFASESVNSSQEVLAHWEAIKKQEKEKKRQESGREESTASFFSVPNELPALMLAEKVQKQAAKIGFDWDDIQGPLAKVQEEFRELQQELGNKEGQAEELGDLLFSIVNLARFLDINAEDALRQGTKKFQRRFTKMLEAMEGERRENRQLSLEKMDFYWNIVKNEEKNGTFGSF